MYLSYYGLESKPFQISSDPKFIWLGEKHREALATLTYGVLDNKGFMLLTGDVGTGKTTLINTLIRNLSADVLHAFVPDPRLELNDFFNYVARAFNIKKEFKSKGRFLMYFSDLLEIAYAENKKVLLLIDEAQLLTQDLLEEIRLLSNIQKDGNNLLNIFFIGQDEFNQVLEQTENRAVAQRLTLNYHLNPLSEVEVGRYIVHRLKIAGTTERLFNDRAVREIHAYSGGFPRRINIICDHCLLNGYVKERRVIDADMVRICAHDLKIPQYTRKAVPPPRPIPPAIQPRRTKPAVAAVAVARDEGGKANPGPSAPAAEYASGNDDLRTDLKQEKANRLLSGIMTTAAILFAGLMIFYILAPGTFLTGYKWLTEKLVLERPNITEMVDEQTTTLKPDERRADKAEGEPGDKRQGTETRVRSNVVEAQDNEMHFHDKPVKEPIEIELQSGNNLKRFETEPAGDQSAQDVIGSTITDQGDGSTEVAAEDLTEDSRQPVTGVVAEVEDQPVGEKSTIGADEILIGESEEGGAVDENGVPSTTETELNEIEQGQMSRADSPQDTLTSVAVLSAVVNNSRSGDSTTAKKRPMVRFRMKNIASEVPQGVLILRFNHDSSDFDFGDLAGLEALVAHLKQRPSATIKISGHTDSHGSLNYNYRLSLSRANMLRSYFLGRGVDPGQIMVKGYGSNVPVASNNTTNGRSLNRRVEIELVE
ncbi:AAA family ATPase [Desulfosediminicola ganghwensis]|uniref:AAA family ATPase n=1 Tax=Desulfosediminicola ganghwensis TaxID=2569540 RepID=UPI0010AC95CF|nr:AAA family ATPase [Desulfosediminicola ganghwensis]